MNNFREIICKHRIINLIKKLCFDVSNCYLKSIILDYFDYDNLKYNEQFKEMINLLNFGNNDIIDFIKNEYIIGEFYNLKIIFEIILCNIYYYIKIIILYKYNN